MTVPTGGVDTARATATTADTIILYDARHAPLQHTVDWNRPSKARRAYYGRRTVARIERTVLYCQTGKRGKLLSDGRDILEHQVSLARWRAKTWKPNRSIRGLWHGSGIVDDFEIPETGIHLDESSSFTRLDVTTKIDPFSSRPISRDEAFCLLAHAPRIAFLGDSLTRFHFFTLNEWLSTGKLQTHLYSKWGNGDGSIHYDTSDRWTHTSSSKHAQHFKKTIPLTSRAQAMCGDDLGVTEIETEYWFLADWHHVEIDAYHYSRIPWHRGRRW